MIELTNINWDSVLQVLSISFFGLVGFVGVISLIAWVIITINDKIEEREKPKHKIKQQLPIPKQEQQQEIQDTEQDTKAEDNTQDNIVTEEDLIKDKPRYKYHKRRYITLRKQMFNSIKEFPKSTPDISKELKIHYHTAQRHLGYLESIGAIKKSTFKLRKGIKELWIPAK